MSLGRQQRDFLETILAREEPADERLAIYHRSARANRVAALAAVYPVVRRLVGESFFEEAAASHVLAHPPRSGDLNAYGASFAAFLQDYPHARDLPYLADIARLEWAMHESRHSPDGDALDYLALGAVPPADVGSVRIRLRPSVRLVASSYPVLAIWEANQVGRDGTADLDRGEERVVVRRMPALDVAAIAPGPAEWIVLEAFARGATVAQAARECADRGLELEPALASLALLEVLGGFDLVQR